MVFIFWERCRGVVRGDYVTDHTWPSKTNKLLTLTLHGTSLQAHRSLSAVPFLSGTERHILLGQAGAVGMREPGPLPAQIHPSPECR